MPYWLENPPETREETPYEAPSQGATYTNTELLEQLRAIGWDDLDIARLYPELLPDYQIHPTPSTTLWERLLSVGWTEEEIRAQHPEILPESEGGILESLGEPMVLEPGSPPTDSGTIYDQDSPSAVPSVEGNQTADLLTLAILFL